MAALLRAQFVPESRLGLPKWRRASAVGRRFWPTLPTAHGQRTPSTSWKPRPRKQYVSFSRSKPGIGPGGGGSFNHHIHRVGWKFERHAGGGFVERDRRGGVTGGIEQGRFAKRGV